MIQFVIMEAKPSDKAKLDILQKLFQRISFEENETFKPFQTLKRFKTIKKTS